MEEMQAPNQLLPKDLFRVTRNSRGVGSKGPALGLSISGGGLLVDDILHVPQLRLVLGVPNVINQAFF